MGNRYRSRVRIVLLLHVQESGQKPITILSYARIGRYVWFNLHLFTHRVGILTLYKAHLDRVRFLLLKSCNYHIW